MKKTFLVMTAFAVALSSCHQATNPLLVDSTAPFGAPEFSKIKSTDYMPAFKEAFKQHSSRMDPSKS